MKGLGVCVRNRLGLRLINKSLRPKGKDMTDAGQ